MNYTFYAYFKFLTELIVATAMFVFPLKRRKYFFLKLVVCLGASYTAFREYIVMNCPLCSSGAYSVIR